MSGSMNRQLAALFIVCLLLMPTGVLAADAPVAASDADSIQLFVRGSATIAIGRATLAAMPRTQVTAAVHAEPPSVWAGVSLVAILHQANVPQAQQLRGREMTRIVRVTGADGYAVVFSLTELDADFSNTTVILADQHEGKPLSADDGPFRLVVPGDKRAARWVRNVRAIEVVDVESAAAPSR
jgi:DMSO/TMAO reductase YedYZ molybdopterin-dependent catalytic subunit